MKTSGQQSYLAPLAIGVAALAATPIVFTFYSAAAVDSVLWKRLFDTRFQLLLPNTLKLLLSVGFLTALFGVVAAWLVARNDFKGRSIWEWALVLPLAVPGYVLAYAYASIMSPGGVAQTAWAGVFGDASSMPSLYSFWGVSFILSFANYPYVYLLTRASFISQNAVYDEAAKALGESGWERFWTIQIRMAYPGIFAGVALALMEVMADFGTVAMLRYPTFTEAIYRQMTGRFDPMGAAALASVLVSITLMLLFMERYFRGRKKFEQTKNKFQPYKPVKATAAKTIIFTLMILTLLFAAFITPVGLLITWSFDAMASGGLDDRFFRFIGNTLIVAAIGASAAVVLALPAAYLHARKPIMLHKLTFYLTTLGYSLPGPVIAVGLLLTVTLLVPQLYGGVTLLIMAYVIRFIPVTLQAQDTSISMVSKSLEEASRMLGAGTGETIRKILLPLIKPGLLTSGVVVFVDCMKELPATLMLRPLAFDTLSVRVWMEASESLWEMAAPPALLIVVAGLIPIIIIMKKMKGGPADAHQIT